MTFGNTIVSNGAGGVDIEGSGTSGNSVVANFIGTDASGDTGLGNVADGVQILDGATDNMIGEGGLGANTIADNSGDGVGITDSGTSGNVLQGNYIGTNAASTTNLGNSGNGVQIQGGATNNTIGTGNVIAGNKNDGIALIGPGTSGVTIEGNDIGTDSAGDSGLGNAFWGVYVDEVSNVVVGAAGVGNVVSGNEQGGVTFRGISSVNESIQGNLIGVAPNGTSPLGNAYSGVLIGDWGVSGDYPSDVTIGGTTSGTGNVISANGEWGVWISGAGVTGVVVEGNTIGTDANSDTGLGNAYSGVQVDSGATSNTIGGNTAGAANLISGNGDDGVVISGTGTSGNVVEGNNIGLNASQSAGLGNTYGGVAIINRATSNTVGGTSATAANVITGNGTASTTSVTYANLAIYDPGTSGNVAEGNFIGTTAGSASGLNATSDYGVFVGDGATGNTVGGAAASSRNVISGNTSVGVEIFDAGPSGNTIQGNYVGTNVAGTAALPNQTTGLLIGSDGAAGGPSTNNVVIDNVLSGNGESGVAIENTSHNTIEDNLIGTNATGTGPVPNSWDGVHLELLQGSPSIGTGAVGQHDRRRHDRLQRPLRRPDRVRRLDGQQRPGQLDWHRRRQRAGRDYARPGGQRQQHRRHHRQCDIGQRRRRGHHLRGRNVEQPRRGQLHRHQLGRHRRPGQLGRRRHDHRWGHRQHGRRHDRRRGQHDCRQHGQRREHVHLRHDGQRGGGELYRHQLRTPRRTSETAATAWRCSTRHQETRSAGPWPAPVT